MPDNEEKIPTTIIPVDVISHQVDYKDELFANEIEYARLIDLITCNLPFRYVYVIIKKSHKHDLEEFVTIETSLSKAKKVRTRLAYKFDSYFRLNTVHQLFFIKKVATGKNPRKKNENYE